MNDVLHLIGQLKSKGSHGRPGTAKIPARTFLLAEKMSRLVAELELVADFWERNTFGIIPLVRVRYISVVAKSNRISRLLLDSQNDINSQIAGAEFTDEDNPRHIVTYRVSLPAIKASLSKLRVAEDIVRNKFQGKITSDDIEGIKKYLKKETDLIDRKIFCIHTGNSVIDVIINTKQHFAEAKGILFVVNAFLPEHGTILDLDLANILGNLLDNAIEASMEEQDPYIDVIIRQEKSFMLIKVTNKYCGELPGNMRSSKKNKIFHGIGIESVKSTVEKYHGEFSIKKQDNEVVVQILLLNQ